MRVGIACLARKEVHTNDSHMRIWGAIWAGSVPRCVSVLVERDMAV